jgi:hypothetical protein
MKGKRGRTKQGKNQQAAFNWAKKELDLLEKRRSEILNELSNRLKKDGLEITNKKALMQIVYDL